MSKKRLEEIKTWLNRGFDLTEEDIEWLIEQAGRVQKLERKIERYKQALEFYADRGNYKTDHYHYDPYIGEYISIIDYDNGATARKALEGEE